MTTGRLSFAAQNVFQGCLISPGGYRQFRNSAEGLYSSSDSLIQRNRHFLLPEMDRSIAILIELSVWWQTSLALAQRLAFMIRHNFRMRGVWKVML
jgi:hypothetical protein